MPPFTRTVRFRLTIWYSSLLLVFGVAFVVALNLAARLDQPDFVELQGVRNDVQWVEVHNGPGNAVSGIYQVVTPQLIVKQAEDQIYSHNLDRLRTWSLLSVVALALASGVGGYVLSGMMLRPVRDITRVASSISEKNFGVRINHQGPKDELWALAKTFDSMIDRLETSFERQRQFVQDASHELRTPLAAIRTNIEVTEMDPDASADEYRSLMETVKAQTARLTHLSEDLLLLTSEDKDTVEKEPVDLPALAKEVVTQLSPLAEPRHVALTVDAPESLEIQTSPDLLYRCVSNLVDNAIKYSGDGSVVAIRVSKQDSQARIEVADNGRGIPAEEVSKIFNRFYRVDRCRSRREGGSGLGLAIVQDVVEALGGDVGVRSTVGEGTTFAITLPTGDATL